ncbi:MAG: RrF2 family transcriptional regulator [Cyanobacteriota bacterium]
MAFSSKTAYGLLALLELAGVQAAGGVLQVPEIAARQGIPDRYLEQMLASLRRGGFLRSIRGPRGGYQLISPPSDVLVLDVVRCLEGLPGASDSEGQSSVEWSALRGFEQELEQARLSLLGGTTLQDLLERRDALLQDHAMYFI